jgi:hypothetical protein
MQPYTTPTELTPEGLAMRAALLAAIQSNPNTQPEA